MGTTLVDPSTLDLPDEYNNLRLSQFDLYVKSNSFVVVIGSKKI